MDSKLLLKRGLLLYILLLGAITSFSQTGSVSGIVSFPDGTPAEMVNLYLENQQKGTVSDTIGYFAIRNVKSGTYTLVYHALGKDNRRRITVNISANTDTYLTLELQKSDMQLNEVVVLGNKTNPFADKKSTYVSRMPLNNIENPQVYGVITKELMAQQITINFDDAIKNTPGIDKLWSSTGRGGDGAAYFTLRGFATQPTMVNGLAGQTNGGLDPANLERIEVIKGPSGTLFGSSLVSFGGLINLVTKKPYEKLGGEFSYTMGGYGLNRIAADINTPLNKSKSALFRVNAAYQYENSFQDAGFKKSFFVAPSLAFNANDKLSFTLNTEFYNSEGTNPLMVFLNRSRPLEYHTPEELGMDYKRSFTSNDITVKTPTVNLFGMMEYKISPQWTSQTSVSQSIRQSQGLYSYVMFLEPVRDDSLWRYVGAQDATGVTTDIQQNFIGDFKIGNMRNRLVAGVDYFSKTESNNSNYIFFDKVNSRGADPKYTELSKAAVEDSLARYSPYKTKAVSNTYSVYFSDVLNVTDQLSLMASLRLDYFDNKGTYNIQTDETSGDYGQTALSPKFGAVYQIMPNQLSVFANYMNGFQNVESGLQPDGTVRNFKPQQANQIEGGVKASLFDGKLTGTMSYYNIYVSDVVRQDPNASGPGYTIQDGDVYSRGFEADIILNPFEGLNIIAGYSYNESENKKSDPYIEGRRPTEAGPRTLVNGWVSYAIPRGVAKGFGFGFGGNYAGKNMITNDARPGVFTLPAYTVLNATMFYEARSFRFGLKVDNLTNKEYWKGWSTVEAQKLRQFVGNISYRF